MSPVLAFPVPVCPSHDLPLSLDPVIWHCSAGRHGHRVQAADLEREVTA